MSISAKEAKGTCHFLLHAICAVVTIGFEQDTYAFDEDSGARIVNVYLTGELARDVLLQVSSIAGTATGQVWTCTHKLKELFIFLSSAAGADYAINFPEFLSFSKTVKNASLTVNIINDQFLEDNETLSIHLTLLDSSDHGAVHLAPFHTDITIIDTDSKHRFPLKDWSILIEQS